MKWESFAFIGVLAAAAVGLVPLAAPAHSGGAFLTGIVTQKGVPVPHALVLATGNNRTVKTTTDASGHFSFPPLAVGTYTIQAKVGDLRGFLQVDVGSGSLSVEVPVSALSEIAHLAVSQSQAIAIHGSGTDVALNATALQRLPFNNSFTLMQLQMPGAAQGANGVVHFNGDHGVINYTIDGVPLPQELNRDIGSEININDLSFVDLIEGAYPAQYGLRFGAVFDMATRAGTGPAGADGYVSMGSYTNLQSQLGYHAPIPGGGGYDVAVRAAQSTRGLDPPNPDSPHNASSSVGQFARFTIPAGGNDFTNVTFVNSHSTFQIPNDVEHGQPATTDDNETQADSFLAVQFHRALGSTGAVSFGPAVKVSRIADFGDPANDFIYGQALNVEPPPFGNGGSPADCANSLKDPSLFTPTTCAYSLADSRTAIDYALQGDYTQAFANHTLGAGVSYDLARVLKYYAITLQPNNYLAPVLTPRTPGAATTVVDDAPNVGSTYQFYVQDSWRISSAWQADYGMRYDYFSIKSTQFGQEFGSFSPRLKLTRTLGKRSNVYAYVGRFFEPFSLENVSPYQAQLLNLPLQRTVAQFDLKPERDTQLEMGGHIPVGNGDLGFRIWQKNANDLIDDTQVGVTLLHQDINYVLGRLSQEALSYVQPLPLNGRLYASVAHVNSLNSGCETQLLAPCFGQPVGYTPADHEQRYTVTGGLLLNERNGGWFSADGYYGSGLSSAICPSSTPGYCKKTPHTIFDVEEGIAMSRKAALTLNVQNLLNDRYYVTVLNAQGNHVAPGREINLGVRFKP
ncbi:MAG: TonB-dependent receptor [Candidatus Eremiobacteraeota bacterium]|nr:TonB-dependent receptor [Candidatus Eremiobacteraeota bacterium]